MTKPRFSSYEARCSELSKSSELKKKGTFDAWIHLVSAESPLFGGVLSVGGAYPVHMAEMSETVQRI